MTAAAGVQFFNANTLGAPAQDAFTVTPNNSTNFNSPARSLYVGGAGDIAIVTAAGNAVTFVGIPAGTFIPVMAIRVNSTSTTASAIVGLV